MRGGAATVLPSAPYRHSRVSGNPERYCLMMVLSTGNRGIPAYAGMTVGAAQPSYYVIPSVAEESKNPVRS